MAYQKPKGTADILSGEIEKWQFLEESARLLFKDYQFNEMRTPIFENYELFARTVGETSDIVSKEMYEFYDKGERHITLRPEGTAPIVRAFVEHKLFGPEFQKPYKAFYMGPMFRYERPQAGRQRQFHQLGAEIFGSANPATDVETIAMVLAYFDLIGLTDCTLVLNSLGDPESRLAYREALIAYLEPFEEELSGDSKRRLHQNPLRVLDSKDPKDQAIVEGAPSILDYLNEASQQHFEAVKEMLAALNIDYVIDSNMVRGLDYYTHTIFEIMSNAKTFGSQTTLCAGGRYNGLVEELGGPDTPGFGFGMGMERILLALDAEGVTVPTNQTVDVYVVGLGEESNVETLKLVQAIRNAGFSAERDYLGRKAKAQFKTANKLEARWVLTLGESELASGKIVFKEMATGSEQEVELKALYADFGALYDQLTKEKD